MMRRWTVAPAQGALAAELAAALKLSPLFCQCLLNRGLAEASAISRFLEPRLKHLSDPFLLPDMDQAVARLLRARAAGEQLVIFGDYDVDGVTATALLHEVLSRLGWNVQFYLPHRFDEGYGLSEEALANCLGKCPATLLLAVDCASTATSAISHLASRGIDTIVLDHHQVCSPPPAAVALVNPHRQGQPGAPFRELCSVGLAFKLAHALVKAGRQQGLPGASEFDLRPLLDLVALGTIADLVPLTGENRTLVAAGLTHLNTLRRPGLEALAQVAGIRRPIGVFEVGFQFGPRLNAAGRLENALVALQLLLARNPAEAGPLALVLDQQNRERQQIERTMAEQALRAVRARFNPETDYIIVEGQADWHLGVVGIVASRVLREFYRPTILVGPDGAGWRGSGRSIEGFDLAAALRSCADLLTRHGGHAMAAGLSLAHGNLDSLRARLNETARRTLSLELLRPVLRIDAETRLAELTMESVTDLNRLEPIGQANPPVQLLVRGVRHQRPAQRLGKDQQHVKMWLTDGQSTHPALWWNCRTTVLPEGVFDVVFEPELNTFQERRSVQLKLLDWRPGA
jgi:single-stranded-DNA-specific exonuclease